MATASLNIVLVEDHDALRDVTAEVLREAGHHVKALSCAEDLGELAGCGVDLFILDLNLPGEDGISLARRLRQSFPLGGIIMTTARSGGQDQALGYASGADIYLVKPLAPGTLLAAIGALQRRLVPDAAQPGLRLARRQLTLSGAAGAVPVQESEANLLSAFARAPGQRLETWQLAEILGGSDQESSKSSIEVRITRLRKKLRDCGADADCIRALRGVGYQLCVPVVIV